MRALESFVSLLLIFVVLLILFGGGGYYGHRAGWYDRSGGAGSGLGLMLLVLVVVLLLGGFGGTYIGGYWR